MRKLKYIMLAGTLFFASACDKSSLDLVNPNEPGLPALLSEEGIKRAGLGVYDKFGLEYWWYTLQYHDIMGDAYFASVGNFSWRWANQPSSITLSNGTVLTPPQGGSQVTELRNRNSRAFGDDNAFKHEWQSMYLVNNQANLVLSIAEDPELTLSGNEDVKRNILKAWAYWWKGFAYSRVSSIYVAGIIANTLNETNNDFITHLELSAEANRNFDLAIAALQGITANEEYTNFLSSMIPSFTKVGKGGVLTPEEWTRNINTYKARNILVSKGVNELSATEWNEILTLTQNGIQGSDKIFTMRSSLTNDLVLETAWQPYRSTLTVWSHISERLIQDYKPGDNRFARNYYESPMINAQGRGFNYSTRYAFEWIEDGGDYATQTAGVAEIPVACSHEENELMKAEALIKTGKISEGLAFVDAVRTYQKAELTPVAGTGLTEAQAYEELRKERRVGLLNKNVAFYDARRWGILKPVANGGGRKGAVVVHVPAGQSAFVVDNNATIDYNYLEWWDVPLNEIDFNEPGSGSAPVMAN